MLTSISAWRLWRFNPPQDSDTSPLDIYENEAISKSNQYSEELRLTSNTKGPFEWQGGAFLYYSQLKDHYVVHQFGADTIAWYDAYQGSAVIPTFLPLAADRRADHREHARAGSE